jgi:regulator of replication initiation timing
MDGLTEVLGKKIATLCECVRQLKTDNSALAEENAQLRMRVKELERALEKDVKRTEQFDQERTYVKSAIDELVQSIDALIDKEY